MVEKKPHTIRNTKSSNYNSFLSSRLYQDEKVFLAGRYTIVKHVRFLGVLCWKSGLEYDNFFISTNNASDYAKYRKQQFNCKLVYRRVVVESEKPTKAAGNPEAMFLLEIRTWIFNSGVDWRE